MSSVCFRLKAVSWGNKESRRVENCPKGVCTLCVCVYVYVCVYLRFSFCFFIRFSRASVRGYIDERTAGLQSVFVNEPSARDIICRLDVRCSTRMFTPGKKHRLLGNGERAKAKRGKNSIEQMAGGVKDGVETHMKKRRNLKKNNPASTCLSVGF